MPAPAKLGKIVFFLLPLLFLAPAQADEDCLTCHEDLEGFSESIHADFSCTDCHDQPGDFEDVPHFTVYRPVDCATCHDDSTESFAASFHGIALKSGQRGAPSCASCHGIGGDPHRIRSLDRRTAESACRRCHAKETGRYDKSVHFRAAARGKNSPGCTSCHPTHGAALPPSTGAVNKLCESCHPGSMEQVQRTGHMGEQEAGGVMSCASCHDVHATDRPHLDQDTLTACRKCHPGYEVQFAGSVHESLIESNDMNCMSCHKAHHVLDAPEDEDFGCGRCHDEAEEEYRSSAHRLARLHGDRVAATCADCHGGHHVLSADDPESPVNHFSIPNTCSKCHGDETVVTSDYVRLPISLPNYAKSVHGVGWKAHMPTAVCTDCHGDHDLQSASVPSSMINKNNLAATCGKCHADIALEYVDSVHGRALRHGITDSPSCTDCHDEHLIYPTDDPHSAVFPEHQAHKACGSCHEDPEMAARYGLPQEVVGSYVDSYHGWAVQRGGQEVAVCEDCHHAHDIRSRADPNSSIHPDNVVETCGRCHENSNKEFAASYTHVLARGKRLIHDWVRLVYIWLIVAVLGGMVIHNSIIYAKELRLHHRAYHDQPTVRRMTRNEVIQHMILAVSFTLLAVTGFALRYADAWWVRALTVIGMTEEARRLIHRVLAFVLVGASLYHVAYLVATSRGRMLLRAVFPRLSDVREAIQNVAYHLGRRKEPPRYAMYDYTQKAEYWALVWGTIVMSVTGFVLMFPDEATQLMPAWVVRVCETIHFYEAILAVSAIIVWHFFFTILLPREYPMSWIWISGRMPRDQWEHHHPREPEETGNKP